MFRSFAVALAMLLSAAAVVFVVVDDASRTGRQVVPVVPGITQLESSAQSGSEAKPNLHVVAAGEDITSVARRYYGDGKLWQPIAEANELTPPHYTIQEGQYLIVPQTAASKVVADPMGIDLFLRALVTFLIISTVMGSIILDQSARILEIPRRSLLRSTAAMILASVAFLCSVVLAWGMSVRLDGYMDMNVLSVITFILVALTIAFLAILAVMKYTYHTTTGKAMFLLVGYRFAFAFSVVTTTLAGWLAVSGLLADGLETVMAWI